MKGLIGAVVALLTVLGLAACGGSGSSDSGQVTVTEKVTTVVKESSPSSSGDSSSSSDTPSQSSADGDSGGGAEVPDETGERLDVAEDDLRSNNLRYKEIGGGTFGIVVRANWTVCKQKPRGGTAVSENTRIKLIVDREC